MPPKLHRAQEPKVMPHAHEMKINIAEALGINPKKVGIKATTNENLGFIGREEGIAAMAVASVDIPERALITNLAKSRKSVGDATRRRAASSQCYAAKHVASSGCFTNAGNASTNGRPTRSKPAGEEGIGLALLDSVRRRITRRLQRPEEEARLIKIISERFPGTEC